jgi:hypothetical protein
MENSNGAYPLDSLSNLIGKRLEEVFPGRDDKVPQHGTYSSGKKMTQSWAPWVSASKREQDLHSSVRESGFIAPVIIR